MKSTVPWIITATLAFSVGCGDPESQPDNYGEAVSLENSSGKSDAGIVITLSDESPEAKFWFECEDNSGCDIALAVDFAQLPMDASGTTLVAEFTRPDGFSKVLEFTGDPEGEIEGIMGQDPGLYDVHLSRPEGVTGEVAFVLGAFWTEAHPVIAGSLGVPCTADADCPSGFFCNVGSGSCTIGCDDLSGLICENGYDGPGEPICASAGGDDAVCWTSCMTDTDCPDGQLCVATDEEGLSVCVTPG